MREFLRETWELWYWAMFCPSKLQQRWSSADKRRFMVQYTLLALCFSIPLTVVIVKSGNLLDLIIILPLTILAVYIARYFSVPFGLNLPLFFVLCYQTHISLCTSISIELLYKSSIAATTISTSIGVIVSILVSITYRVFKVLFVIQPIEPIEILLETIFEPIFVFHKKIKNRFNLINLLLALIEDILGQIVLFTFVIVLFINIFNQITISYLYAIKSLPLPLFILLSCFLGISIESSGRLLPRKMIIIQCVMITTGLSEIVRFTPIGWRLLLAVILIFISYYRLIPEYLFFTLISLFLSVISQPQKTGIFLEKGSVSIRHYCPIPPAKPVKLLRLLPPHSTELLWLPLPGHYRILAAAFRTDSEAALATFQQMQASPLPGFRPTIKQALPQIIADKLTVVSNIPELVATAKSEHPLLPLLIPTFYQSETELENSTPERSAPFIKAEIFRVIPRLQTVAKDVEAALEAGSAALRERALERILNNLLKLQAQLPGLGLEAPAIKRWQPVLEHWYKVIDLELKQQQVQSQGELLNPFSYGNPLPLHRKDIFKGRQAFVDRIFRLILDRNRPTIVLHAPRRFGKSSFLRHLPRLLPSDLIPIYIDMQSSAVTTDEAAFCYSLVRSIYKDSRSQGIQLPAIPQRQEFRESPYIALEDWLDEALPRLEDRRLLLNLDEFEKIGSAIKEGRLSLRLFDQLRHLIQHYDRLSFLFSGVQTLEEMGPNWSSYFISVVPIEMLYLEPEEAEDLLVNPDPEFALRYDRNILAEILQLTRCHPYLLQLLGAAMVTQANLNHTQLVTSELLQAAIQDAFTLGEPYFINIWTEFTGTNPQEVAAGQKFLLSLAANQELPSDVSRVGDPEALAALRRLRRYHVIEETDRGNYRFEVPLFSMWVRDRAIRNDLS